MIKTIVFDFGNVIGFFDPRPAFEKLAQYTALSAEALIDFLYEGELEDAYESGRMSSAEFLRRVREGCRLSCSEKALIDIYCDIFRPNDEVCRLVPLLKPHYKLLLGSNTTELHAQQFLRQFADILRPFDAVILSWQIGARKPRPEFFRHCQERAQSEPQECLFIDDLPANVAGAQQCGWQGLVYHPGNDLVRQAGGPGRQGQWVCSRPSYG